MKKNSNFNRGMHNPLCLIYVVVSIYATVLYLLCAFQGDMQSYNVMMNLSLALGLFSGIIFVEADKAKRWIVPAFLGALWVAGVAIGYAMGYNYLRRDSSFLFLLFAPFLSIWALSWIKKGQNAIRAFVGAVFALFSVGLLPGRGKLELLYDIFIVVSPMMSFAIVARNQSRPQRWHSWLIFMVVYSYIIIVSFYTHIIKFVIVATSLLSVLGVLSASWNDNIKKSVFASLVCLMSAIAIIAIPSWSSFATMRFYYPEHTTLIEKQLILESPLVTPDNDTISLESLQGKTVVLYFWTASCGACHAMMPDFSAFAKSYSNSANAVFYAVFLGENADELRHYEEMTHKDYAFKWVRALDAKEVMERLKFNLAPHLTIISPDRTVAYNGIVDFNRMNVYHPRRYLK